MKAKKVIWIVNEYNGPNGGVCTRQTVLGRLLKEKGYEVYIIAGSADYKYGPNYLGKETRIKRVQHDGVVFYVIRTNDFHNNVERVLTSLSFQRRLWKYRRELPFPDVIINNFAGLFGNVVLKWKRKYDTKIIFDILDLWPETFVALGHLKRESLLARYLYSLEHKAYREADSLVFSFQGGRDYLIDRGWSKEVGGDVDTSNIGYLNNGVDLASLKIQKDKYVYSDEDLDSDKFKVIYLGSISEFNGLDILLDVASIVQRKTDKIVFLVYGYGNREEQLKEKATSMKIKNLVFKGKIEKEYAMNVLSRGDVNVFTFKDTPLLKYGTSPNKLFMYFASGKPVISMIRPAYDLVEKSGCGVSVENDAEQVADALMNMADAQKEEYDMYCRNSDKIARQYDYRNLVSVLIDRIEG